MTDKEKLNTLVLMLEEYKLESQTLENNEDFATEKFNEIERFIQENSNTVVLIPLYASTKDFLEAYDKSR